MIYKLKGVMIEKGECRTFKNDSCMTPIVVKESDPNLKYPQEIPIEFWNEKSNDLFNAEEGCEVEVEFTISARLWNDKRFLSLRGRSLNIVTTQVSDGEEPPAQNYDFIPVIDDGEMPF